MMDIVDRIDEVAPVCGWCSTPLSLDGASLDFCTEDCHTRWHAERSERLVESGEAGLRQLLREQARSEAEAIYELRVNLRPLHLAFQRCADQWRRAFEELARAVADHPASALADEPYRTRRMEAALEARRNRNTGPRQQSRAPRRIEARRSR